MSSSTPSHLLALCPHSAVGDVVAVEPLVVQTYSVTPSLVARQPGVDHVRSWEGLGQGIELVLRRETGAVRGQALGSKPQREGEEEGLRVVRGEGDHNG